MKIIFKPKSLVHYTERSDKDRTRVSGSNWIKEQCLGTTYIYLTNEEMKVIDDIIKGVNRRKNIKNNLIN